MDSLTYETLTQRIGKLELDVGENDNSGLPLALQVADLQAKVEALYRSSAELQTLDRITKSLQEPKKHIPEIRNQSQASEAEKQEILLAKFPAIREAYANLAELLTLDIPRISAEAVSQLDLLLIKQRQEAVEKIVKAYHMLVVKNTLVFEKYMALMERENNFWISVEKRFNEMKFRLDQLEDKEILGRV